MLPPGMTSCMPCTFVTRERLPKQPLNAQNCGICNLYLATPEQLPIQDENSFKFIFFLHGRVLYAEVHFVLNFASMSGFCFCCPAKERVGGLHVRRVPKDFGSRTRTPSLAVKLYPGVKATVNNDGKFCSAVNPR